MKFISKFCVCQRLSVKFLKPSTFKRQTHLQSLLPLLESFSLTPIDPDGSDICGGIWEAKDLAGVAIANWRMVRMRRSQHLSWSAFITNLRPKSPQNLSLHLSLSLWSYYFYIKKCVVRCPFTQPIIEIELFLDALASLELVISVADFFSWDIRSISL